MRCKILPLNAAITDWKKVIKVFALPWFQKMLGVAMMVVFAVVLVPLVMQKLFVEGKCYRWTDHLLSGPFGALTVGQGQ